MRPFLIPCLTPSLSKSFSTGLSTGISFAALGAIAACGSLHAADKTFVGPRAHGMAGANVASVNTAAAQFYNPGALGFFRKSVGYVDATTSGTSADGESIPQLSSADNHRLAERDFDMAVDAAIGYRFTGDMGTYLSQIADIDFNAISNTGGAINQGELDDILTTLSILGTISEPQHTIVVNSSAGANIRIKNYAIGVRGFGNFVARVSKVDTANLGLDFGTINDFNNALEGLESNLPGGNFAGYNNQHLSGAMQTALGASGAGYTDNAIKILDYQIGIGISSGAIDADSLTNVTNLLATVTDIIQNGGGDLDNNTTTVRVTGIAHVEIPVSYGYAFNDRFSIGVSPKLMIGRVYGSNIQVIQDNDDIFGNMSEEFNESETVSIDAGAMYRMNNLQFGIQGSNLTSPTFKGFTDSGGHTFADISIDPQVTVGVAWIPHATVTVEVDLELLETQSANNSLKTQFLSLGAEWKALQFLALRAGAYQNLANSDVGIVYTGGIGINLSLLEFDLAASVSPKMIDYDGNKIPQEASVGLGLMLKF